MIVAMQHIYHHKFIEIESAKRVQILDEVVVFYFRAYALEKGTNLSVLPPAIGK